jgi:histidine triad (HIT) family protein
MTLACLTYRESPQKPLIAATLLVLQLRGREIMDGVSNIVLPTSGSCPFCAFLLGEKPYTILRRSELVAILVTREQRGVSHLLVVPVRHCPTILDLRDEESGALMREIRHAARIVDAADRRPGIAIWQNNGLSANQAVAHVHFHVAGTLEEGGTRWGEVPRLSVAETDAMAERLRQVEASRPADYRRSASQAWTSPMWLSRRPWPSSS